jgi:hypothetical protein
MAPGAGGATAWRPGGVDLLSGRGVEQAIVVAVALLKAENVIQLASVLILTRGESSRPVLELAAAGAITASGLAVLAVSVRRRRLSRAMVGVDVLVGVAVLLLAPAFQPDGQGQQWTDWPLSVTFLVAAEACACFSRGRAAASTLALMAAAGSWLLHDGPNGATRHMVVAALIAYTGFAGGTYVFLSYLRRLGALADARGETIRHLEEEKTRRVLHTPYRLLNDLAAMLRAEHGRDDADPVRRARLAEAVASAMEIEAIVRGTERPSGRLVDALAKLQDQFVDLPLIMNVDDAPEIPPEAVYRVREAVRSALQNVRLYAGAREVVVYAGRDADGWTVSIHDDGCGFDPSGPRHTGLNDLVVRALEQIGVQVGIESAPGRGTLVEMKGGAEWTGMPDSTWSSSTTTR